jgi:hypothetical protein
VPDFDDLVRKGGEQREAEEEHRHDDGHRHGVAAMGNAAVQRLMRSLGVSRAGAAKGGEALDPSLAQAIQGKRGGGDALDSTARRSLEPALGADFSGVRVHTDGEADALAGAVRADAFTTGKDIFFKDGKYQPGSSDGQKLLAHELTHVVQQRNAPAAGDWRVSDPGDASEREAAAVAEQVSGAAAEGAPAVAREEAPEEEELQMSPAVAREEAPEEEELQMSPAIAREEAPEEEELQMSPSVAREEAPEEEELQMSPAVAREATAEEEEAAVGAASPEEAAAGGASPAEAAERESKCPTCGRPM